MIEFNDRLRPTRAVTDGAFFGFACYEGFTKATGHFHGVKVGLAPDEPTAPGFQVSGSSC